MDAPSPFAQSVRTAQAAISLIEQAGITPDDPDYLTLIESECDALERLRRMLRAARRAEGDAKTLGEMIEEMKERRERFTKKAQSLRSTVLWAMEEMGLSRLDAPDLTASISAPRPAVIITDEAAIPQAFLRIKAEPSKTAIKEALERGETVPGAVIGNSAPALSVRTR